MDSDLLTTGEAATYLRISRFTLRQLRLDGRIRCKKLVPKSFRYRQSDLDAFLNDTDVQGSRVPAQAPELEPA
jgi:excisionase family DNA binding protein